MLHRLAAAKCAKNSGHPMLSCSRSWVYKLIEAGHLKAFRIGSRKGLQITVRSLEAYLAKQAVNFYNIAE